MSETLLIMSQKSLGAVGIVDEEGRLIGMITDGDIRRNSGTDGLLTKTAGEIMNRSPKTVSPGTLASEAVKILNERKITSLFVVEDNRPVGLVHIHDFLKAGVVGQVSAREKPGWMRRTLMILAAASLGAGLLATPPPAAAEPLPAARFRLSCAAGGSADLAAEREAILALLDFARENDGAPVYLD